MVMKKTQCEEKSRSVMKKRKTSKNEN